MSKEPVEDVNGFTLYELPQPCTAKFVVTIVDKGSVVEVSHFSTLKEAKRAFGEIAHDYSYKPNEIHKSNHYDVSIWKWTEDRYEKVFPKDKRLT